MKVSIITVVYNGERFLEDCIRSVLAQDYPDLEYIIVDGASKDGTAAILEEYSNQINTIISEPDKGIYDAMNKGIRAATGELIGFMNADDFFPSPDTVSRVVETMNASNAEAVIGNVVYVKQNEPQKKVRYFHSKGFKPTHFKMGNMPPHLSFYTRKSTYERLGLYRTDLKITSDFELLLRFLYKAELKYAWMPGTTAVMRMGGVSSSGIKSNIQLNREIMFSCRENNVRTSYLRIYSKYFKKIWGFLNYSDKDTGKIILPETYPSRIFEENARA